MRVSSVYLKTMKLFLANKKSVYYMEKSGPVSFTVIVTVKLPRNNSEKRQVWTM